MSLKRFLTTYTPRNVIKNCVLVILVTILLVLVLTYTNRSHGRTVVWSLDDPYAGYVNHSSSAAEVPGFVHRRWRVIHVGVDVCGDRMDEAVTLVKSILILTRSTIQFHLFLSRDMKQPFTSMLKSLPQEEQKKFLFKIYDIGFPSGQNQEMWKTIHKPCASQNLFYTDRLPHVDAIINFDIDIILMRPIDDLWDHFGRFSDRQIMAGIPKNQPDRETVSRFTHNLPFYGQEGVNTGLVLMNLTRMRAFNWTRKAIKYFYKFKNRDPKKVIDDQVVTGIIFYFYPDRLYTLGCDWNFRLLHCHKKKNRCKEVEMFGVSIVHGVGESFHERAINGKNFPTFAAVFQAFDEHKMGIDSVSTLVANLKKKQYAAFKKTLPYRHICTELYWTFSKVIEKYA